MVIPQLFAAKASYTLGLTNLLGLFLVFFSCRCIMGSKLNQTLAKSSFYMKFYQYHCSYWWFFMVSVLLHGILAITAFGNPFR